MILLYDGVNVPEQAIEPIRWTVREFVLIHSLLGRTEHIPLGRWPLRGGTAHRKPESRMAITIYGIKNCDTMKKARTWLDQHGVAYAFHDYKAAGIDRPHLEDWCAKLGWESLLNRAGTTFRNLPDGEKQGLDERKAVALMMALPSMIKRPVLDLGSGRLLVGFKPELYGEAAELRAPA